MAAEEAGCRGLPIRNPNRTAKATSVRYRCGSRRPIERTDGRETVADPVSTIGATIGRSGTRDTQMRLSGRVVAAKLRASAR